MIAVISGDIIHSRKLDNQEKWLSPLKNLFATWGECYKEWKIDRGDFFQVEIKNPKEALKKALIVKSLIKQVASVNSYKKSSEIDVRMAIGIGEKIYTGENISESNGTAFIHSGEKYDQLKKENTTIGIKSPWNSFDEEMNLYLKLGCLFMDKWTISSAELVELFLKNSQITQEEIGKQLGIKQSAVSRRWKRANLDEIIEVEKMYQKKLNHYMHVDTH